MRLSQRLAVSILAVAAVLAVSGVVIFRANHERASALARMEPVEHALEQLAALRVAVIDGADHPWEVTGGQEAVDSLRATLAGTEWAPRLESDVVDPYLRWGETVRSSGSANPTGATPLLAQWRDDLASFEGDLLGQLRIDEAARSAASRHLEEALVVVFVLIAVCLALAWFLLRKSILRPIGELMGATARVSAGELGGEVVVGSPPEFKELAADVDAMRRRLIAAYERSEREREALEQNVIVVWTLSSQMAPQVEDVPANCTLALHLEPAEGVLAGDCVDVVELSETRVALFVVDVAGHGALSGIISLRCKELLRAGIRSGLEPGAAIAWLDENLDLPDAVVVTCAVVVVDTETGSVAYANAGHPPVLCCTGEAVLHLESTGPLLSILPGAWVTGNTHLSPGDSVVLYTDGLVERRDARQEEFGVDRLVSLVARRPCDEASALVKDVITAVREWGDSRFVDDVTIAILAIRPGEGDCE